jgi:dTDP-glucose 4,6-dehydratase
MEDGQKQSAMLVTGGAGFIGSNFIQYLLRRPAGKKRYQVVNLDKLTYAGNLENLKAVENHPDYRFVQGDIGDPDLVGHLFASYHFDYVVNFAAESHVDRSITDPEIFVKTNVLGTVNLLNVAKKHWVEQLPPDEAANRKFLQVSTDEVYGSLGATGYFTELTPLNPHSPYSASKAGADLLVAAYGDTYRLPVNITRCSNNYGPYQFPEKLIPLMINNARDQKALPVYGDGMNVRDWLYVEDHCQAIALVLENGRPGEVYNIGGHNERTNIRIVETIIAYLHENGHPEVTEALIKHVADRKGHDRRYGIDPTKITTELGWRPETDFETGIKRTIEWYLNNVEWLGRVTSGEYQDYYEKMYKL